MKTTVVAEREVAEKVRKGEREREKRQGKERDREGGGGGERAKSNQLAALR